MGRLTLPPEYVRADVDILYRRPEIKDGAKVFYLQLRGLAWGKDVTPWVSMDELEELTGKGHSAIWGYMSTLRAYRRLSWRTSGDGKFMFIFAENDNSENSEQLRESGIASTTTVKESIKSVKEEEGEQLRKIGVTPKNRSGMPTTPKEAQAHPDIRVYVQVSARVPGQAQYKQVIDTIQLLREKLGADDEQLMSYLKPYRDAWVNGKRKDGQLYNPAAIAWLTEWALNGHIPQQAAPQAAHENVIADKDAARARIQRARAAAGGVQ